MPGMQAGVCNLQGAWSAVSRSLHEYRRSTGAASHDARGGSRHRKGAAQLTVLVAGALALPTYSRGVDLETRLGQIISLSVAPTHVNSY